MRSELLRVLNFVSKIDQMEEPPALLAELRAQLAPFGVCCLSVSLIQVGGRAAMAPMATPTTHNRRLGGGSNREAGPRAGSTIHIFRLRSG